MTRTISLITATVAAALLFAVPAYADNWGADKAQPTNDNQQIRVSPDLADRGIVAEQIRLSAMLDARERSLEAGVGNGKVSALDARERSFETKQAPSSSPDWFERAAETAIRDNRVPVVDDRFTIDPTSAQNPVTVSSGREIELPQVGVGLGIGLMLAFGLYLLMRYSRGRQLAH
jgi:hypothetical protein